MKPIIFKTVKSNAITAGSEIIQIESKRLILPFPVGGFVFQTPTAVYNVQTHEKFPIWDMSRIPLFFLWAIGLLVPLLSWIHIQRQKDK